MLSLIIKQKFDYKVNELIEESLQINLNESNPNSIKTAANIVDAYSEISPF